MARAKRGGTLAPRKCGEREYRKVCWVSSEGTTEKDYLRMRAFAGSGVTVRFPKEVHPGRRDPVQVLRRFEKALRTEDFRKGDEAWLVVDVDGRPGTEFSALLEWEASDPRHHLAVSNPKFELFLVMHYGRASGCTTPRAVDEALRRHWPRYDKRVGPTQFDASQIAGAIANARLKRAGCPDRMPAPGMTDAHLLAERLLGGGRGA